MLALAAPAAATAAPATVTLNYIVDGHEHLERWRAAGLIDDAAAARIVAFEAARPDTRRIRWPVIVALSFGAVLLASGLFLFVEAHWDDLSPSTRIATVILALAALHAGAAASHKFPALVTTLHAIGTASLGGAIAISGQVFNLEEHWPLAFLLWAIGAWIGFLLLRDIPQLIMAAVLTPAWVVAEIVNYESIFPDPSSWTAAFVAVLAMVYLSANHGENNPGWRHALAAVGSIAVIPAGILTAALSNNSGAAWWLLLLPLPAAYLLRGRDSWPILGWIAWAAAQLYLASKHMPLAGHFLAGIASVALAAWGIAELRKERVNLGMAAFVITVLSFYFSYVADAINRSLGLIVLGLVFLAGGWQLERLRRRLMHQIEAQRA